MKINGVSISDGNRKTGAVPSVSLLACESCPKNAPCKADCYVVRNMYWRDTIKNAHASNLKLARVDPGSYLDAVMVYLERKAPRLFRWHISGDMLDQDYVDGVVYIARAFPEIRFLAFTKRHDLDYRGAPDNLTIVYSMWPGWGDADTVKGPRAWMQDGTETRVPADAIECPGNCETCGMCWSLPSLKRDVVFHKH